LRWRGAVMARRIVCFLLVISVGFLYACSARLPTDDPVASVSSDTTSALPAPTTASASDSNYAEHVLVSGDAEDAPVECRPTAVAQRLSSLFAAINQADPNIVPDFFGKQGQLFQWYSMTEFRTSDRDKRHFVAHNLDDLATYFTQRYTQHEHLQLQQVNVNSWDSARGLVHFGPVVVLRAADDLPPGVHQTEGKGAFHCETLTFVVLSLTTQTKSAG
jgi:hypothetical protein